MGDLNASKYDKRPSIMETSPKEPSVSKSSAKLLGGGKGGIQFFTPSFLVFTGSLLSCSGYHYIYLDEACCFTSRKGDFLKLCLIYNMPWKADVDLWFMF